MDPVEPELQWWAEDRYAGVVRGLARTGEHLTREAARKRVNRLIRRRFALSRREPVWAPHGNPLWDPRGDQARETLRAAIRANRSLEHELA